MVRFKIITQILPNIQNFNHTNIENKIGRGTNIKSNVDIIDTK